ncbi:MAG: glutamate racemase [Sulfurifustaceae bacterium]
MSNRCNLPIGVFDSGLGGLTVVRALRKKLPAEDVLYFGDTARVPYGIKSEETVARFALQIVDFLLAREVKLLVVACNTVAAIAARRISEVAPVPVVDVIAAGAKCAVEVAQNRRIGVLGTIATVRSRAYERAIQRLDPSAKVFSKACPLFVPLVEEGWLDHPVTRLTAEEYLTPLLSESLDAIVLGCTHYPLIKAMLHDVVGRRTDLVDSADAVALEVERILETQQLRNTPAPTASLRCYVTDFPQRFQEIGERFLGAPLPHLERVSDFA